MNGGVPERSKGLAWKASVPFTRYRGFESLPLRINSLPNRAAFAGGPVFLYPAPTPQLVTHEFTTHEFAAYGPDSPLRMIHSMTGFGRGQATHEAATVTVEVRSVNKRHLDVSVRGPRGLGERELAIKQAIKDRFNRGQFRVSVDLDSQAASILPLGPERAQAVANTLRTLRDAAGIDAPVTLDHVLDVAHRFLDDTETPTARSLPEATWTAVQHALTDALNGLHAMRTDEGTALFDDLTAQIDALSDHLGVVEKRAPVRVDEAQDLLQARLSDLLSDDRLDRDRLETEIAVLADKLDVHEECVRLQSHIRQFREALNDDDPAGRRLKFIMQEMLREVNTIGAKANDATISEHAVQMKEVIEQIREQIRNVE